MVIQGKSIHSEWLGAGKAVEYIREEPSVQPSLKTKSHFPKMCHLTD